MVDTKMSSANRSSEVIRTLHAESEDLRKFFGEESLTDTFTTLSAEEVKELSESVEYSEDKELLEE
jgi:hypothetical protein